MTDVHRAARDVHPAARDGFSREAAAYERGRPNYPDALVDWLRGSLSLGPGTAVVDLGAGTGKFTRLLRSTGAEVTAIEPVDEMRLQLGRKFPDIRALAGTAQSMPLRDRSVHAVTCAQAFHWFATTDALSEIRRVLVPGGSLGIVWNVRDESVGWVAALSEIVHPYEGDAPRYRTGAWRRLFPSDLFADPEESVFDYRHVGSPEEVIVDRFLSVSFIAALAPAEKVHVAARLREVARTHPELKGRETIAFPYQTRAYRCAARPDR
jgi:SAM-dependent methyltransferase